MKSLVFSQEGEVEWVVLGTRGGEANPLFNDGTHTLGLQFYLSAGGGHTAAGLVASLSR